MKLQRMEAVLARLGWRLDRITASHRHYRNDQGQRLTFSHHGGELSVELVDNIARDLRRLSAEARQRVQQPRSAFVRVATRELPVETPITSVRSQSHAPSVRRLRKAAPTYQPKRKQAESLWALPAPMVLVHAIRFRRSRDEKPCQWCGIGEARALVEWFYSDDELAAMADSQTKVTYGQHTLSVPTGVFQIKRMVDEQRAKGPRRMRAALVCPDCGGRLIDESLNDANFFLGNPDRFRTLAVFWVPSGTLLLGCEADSIPQIFTAARAKFNAGELYYRPQDAPMKE